MSKPNYGSSSKTPKTTKLSYAVIVTRCTRIGFTPFEYPTTTYFDTFCEANAHAVAAFPNQDTVSVKIESHEVPVIVKTLTEWVR